MEVDLKHHYGWETYATTANSIEDAAKQAVRESHDFLTDTNHTMEAGPRSITWGGKEVEFNSVLVYRGADAPQFNGPAWAETDYWFAVEYRATQQKGATNGQE